MNHLNLVWVDATWFHADYDTLNEELGKMEWTNIPIQPGLKSMQEQTKVQWKIWDKVIFNTRLWIVRWLFRDPCGYSPKKKWEVSEIYTGNGKLIAASSWSLEIDNQLFIPTWYTSIYTRIVWRFTDELIRPTKIGWWIPQMEYIHELWRKMCTSGNSYEEICLIVQKLEAWWNREKHTMDDILRSRRAKKKWEANI